MLIVLISFSFVFVCVYCADAMIFVMFSVLFVCYGVALLWYDWYDAILLLVKVVAYVVTSALWHGVSIY